MKRVVALVLCFVTVLSLCLSVSASDWENPFTDVREGQWFYEGVRYVTEEGLFAGMSETTFGPGMKMTRAMLVTVLWRHAGQPAAGKSPFSDVPDGKWYSEAVTWAAEYNVVSGVGNGKFDPNGNITREQLATILHRYGVLLGMPEYVGADVFSFSFPDNHLISDYAYNGMSWAVSYGILSGVAQGSEVYLQPKGHATRAQVALMLKNFVAALEEEGCTSDLPEETETEITVGDKTVSLGMTEASLTALCGEPSEKLMSYRGFTWYVYGTQSYEDFFMVGIYQDRAVALCAAGPGFTYAGLKAGDAEGKFVDPDGVKLYQFTDQNDNDILHCVMLINYGADLIWVENNDVARHEARVVFHLTNAFRVFHGKSILTWCDKAAEAARLHSQDMSDNNNFSHTGTDGSNAGQRMTAAGVNWRGWGENIAYGHQDGVTVYNGWVNSCGHRDNMLTSGYTHLGVGCSANSGRYYTQNFYM